MLSIDVILDALLGDMTSNRAVEFWVGQIRAGRVQGLLAGPPCETWSAVRYVLLTDEPHKSPPPLRSRTVPWGLQGLSYKQYQQVALGNKLLRVTLRCTLELVRSGGFAIVEHPAPSSHIVQAPSIWNLAATKWILEVPGAELVKFNQGLHGQISQKPTCLLALRLPTLKEHVKKPQCAIQRATSASSEPLCGKNEDGSWKTSPAKEYPPSMNRALAKACADTMDQGVELAVHIRGPRKHPIEQLMERYQQFVQPHNPYCQEQATMGQDCMLFNERSTRLQWVVRTTILFNKPFLHLNSKTFTVQSKAAAEWSS